MGQQKELLEALVELQKQIRAHHRMTVKKDYSLMVADAQATKVIMATRAAIEADQSAQNEPSSGIRTSAAALNSAVL